ncbi:unnamed protein product [Bursaphelenchus xylophilus]|uniref:glucuronosyltransferase n=1 Tax=Bursaphelenchus xylophilus TaxID=6326 RepID=A0A7I8XIR6_BURXY|nr:unnamed protein product [Bursaphelenchus xylophilus]CAG9125280.1 unnamed protein product [Bursaphelenchus xylophilus]
MISHYLKCFLLLSFVSASYSYKILVWSPTVSKSHMIQNGRVADTLALGGHNTTLIEVDYSIEPGSVKAVRHANYWPVSHHHPDRIRGPRYLEDILSDSIYKEYYVFHDFFDFTDDFCLDFLRNKELMDKVKAEKYDAIFYEQYDFCPIVIAQALNIKVKVWMSSCPQLAHQVAIMGIPFEASYVPAAMNNPNGDRMNFFERIGNIIRLYLMYDVHVSAWNRLDSEVRKIFGDNFPRIVDIAKTADLVFVNTDEIIDFPRPLPPNVIHVGGLGMSSVHKDLEAPFDDLMTKGPKGVVLFSLGSVVPTKLLPPQYMKNVLDTLAKFKDYFFIVKVCKDDLSSIEYANGTENVYVNDWIPQAGILAHPRLQLFITHGGYNSIVEAGTFSIPLLLIGMIFDQPRNARLVERNGWGLSLDKLSLLHGAEEFEAKLTELLTNKKYKTNAQRVSRLMKTKPQTGEQKFLSYLLF